jgi:hypothetical protein
MFRFVPLGASGRNTGNRCPAGTSSICSAVPLLEEDNKIKGRETVNMARTPCAGNSQVWPGKAAQSGTCRQGFGRADVSPFRSPAQSGTSGTVSGGKLRRVYPRAGLSSADGERAAPANRIHRDAMQRSLKHITPSLASFASPSPIDVECE